MKAVRCVVKVGFLSDEGCCDSASSFPDGIRRLNLEVSLFERLERGGHPVHMLTVQYRMHPEIRAFPSGKPPLCVMVDVASVLPRCGACPRLGAGGVSPTRMRHGMYF